MTGQPSIGGLIIPLFVLNMHIVCIFISIRETAVMQEIDRAREIEIGIKEEKDSQNKEN